MLFVLVPVLRRPRVHLYTIVVVDVQSNCIWVVAVALALFVAEGYVVLIVQRCVHCSCCHACTNVNFACNVLHVCACAYCAVCT